MRFSQHELLDRLGVAFLAATPVDNVHPVVMMDKDTGIIFGGEVRKETDADPVSFQIMRFEVDGRTQCLCALQAEPVAGRYAVASFEINGKPVAAHLEAACAFARMLMAQIAAGQVPDVTGLALTHAGLLRLV